MANLYNSQFYDKQSQDSFESGKVILDILFQKLAEQVTSLVDFGCGVAPWLAAAKELGVENIYGTDGDYVPRDRLLVPETCFHPNDLSQPSSIVLPENKFDLAMSLEVAEHLPAASAKAFVHKLCDSTDIVLFSAAIPYQGGHGHVNENWPEYWADLFAEFDFAPFDIIRPAVWNNEKVCWWYKQNLLLFVKKNKAVTLLPNYSSTPLNQLSLIHPEQYLVSVHRSNQGIKRGAGVDINYWRNLLNKAPRLANPNYGSEFSYIEKETVEINTIADLLQADSFHERAVIKDAVSDVLLIKNNPLSMVETDLIKGRSPDFLCIGAQKSATTWLYQVLQNQNNVWVPPIKEINFFNSLYFDKSGAYSGVWRRETALQRLNQALNNNKNIHEGWLNLLVHLTKENINSTWYKQLFEFAPKHKIAGEVTPEYAMLPVEAIKHVYAINPALKVVLLLRSPIDRAISHLKMIKFNEPALSTDCLLEISKKQSVFGRGNYPKIIDNWQSVFPKEQIMIAFYEDIASDSAYFIAQLSAFLGINIDVGKLQNNKVHQAQVSLDNEDVIRHSLQCDFSLVYKEMFLRFPKLRSLWGSE